MSVSINGTSGLTFNDGSTQNTGATGFGFKNRIINGAMMIDQRNAGASVTANDGTYCLDRWKMAASPASKYTAQQNAGSVTPPVGFTNYLGITSSSAYSVGAGDYEGIQQRIEGFNVADLGWGTANAATITISFWVRSSLTGTFGGSLYNSAANRSYPFTFTISVANTWEQKTITVSGDTSGTWTTNNTAGLTITFGLGVGTTYSGTAGSWVGSLCFSATGATSVVGTNGATFYITGVQLEKGSTATSFDYRPYGTELQLCQRYYQLQNGLMGVSAENTVNTLIVCSFGYKTQMRATPSASQTGLIRMEVPYGAASSQSSASVSVDTGTTNTGGAFVLNNFSGLTYARTYRQMNISSADMNSIALSAEL